MAALTRRTLSLSLALTPGVGGKTVTRVLTRNDLLGRTTEEFLRVGQESLREEYRFTAKAAAAWSSNTEARIDRAKAVEDRLSAHGVQLVTAADAHYPRRIEQMDSDPPGVLFLFGNARLLEADTFSVLSSRDTTARGLEAIEKLTEEGVLAGKTLVSGHDTPEYQRSAIVPLRWGAPRILVLDRGLFRALGEELKEEPFRAARLWRFQFDDKTDLAVSCLNPDSDYHPNSNKIRDRLIASLSSTIDMVEIRSGGNMDALAKSALRAGRPVRICDWAGAAKNLAKIGAKPMTV